MSRVLNRLPAVIIVVAICHAVHIYVLNPFMVRAFMEGFVVLRLLVGKVETYTAFVLGSQNY